MLLALSLLGEVSDAMRDSQILKLVLSALGQEPLIAVLVAAGLTWLAHSSLAMVLFVMSLAASGAIEPKLAMALVLGLNLGGSLASYVALSGSAPAARRVALGNLVARLAVAVAALPLSPRATVCSVN
jgi:phosphate:Na+ symporter